MPATIALNTNDIIRSHKFPYSVGPEQITSKCETRKKKVEKDRMEIGVYFSNILGLIV